MCEFHDNSGLLRGLRFTIVPALIFWGVVAGIAYLIGSVWE